MSEGERYGQPWTAEEVTLALYLYCQIPFRKTKANNPAVQRLAERLGRTPASVARKLGNFGSFDPILAERHIVGLAHTGKTDLEIWKRYENDWASLVDDATVLWNGITGIAETHIDRPSDEAEPALVPPVGPSQTRRTTNVRLHQAFFRRAVLTSYEGACCACGIEIPELLTASHIVPWAQDETLRADPSNGLCLCAIHDRAFDRGLITISQDGLLLASRTLATYKSDASRTYLADLDGSPIRQPRRFSAKPEYLEWHRGERIPDIRLTCDVALRALYRTLETPGKNPLRDAQDALDRAVRAAYGMPADADPLAFLLDLNLSLAAIESSPLPSGGEGAGGEGAGGEGRSGEKRPGVRTAVTPPGLPAWIEDPEAYVTDDCIRPALP